MKLLFVAALAALVTADKLQPQQPAPPDAAAAAGVDYLDSKPEQSYEEPQTNHIPYAAQGNFPLPPNQFYNPQNNLPQWNAPQNNFNLPPVNNWNLPQNNFNLPPVNNWNPPQGWKPPVNGWKPPVTGWKPPQNPWQQSDYPSSTVAPANDYYNYPAPAQPSTTQVAIIKNENLLGKDGSYKYEYETGDQTHVLEEGYSAYPGTEHESLVKKGFYSYVGGDGKTYAVTYWADDSGFHAFGDHLPTPPPIPPAIQAALEQNAREEAAAAEAEAQKNKFQGQYPPQVQQPQYVPPQQPYVPPQQSYVPPQPSYVPPQQTYVPPQNSYVPPQQYDPPQQAYVPPQQSYVPPQQSYVPPQQSYVPPQQPNVPPQNSYVPPQQSYVPPQQTYRPS